jgi:hypothetical protein
VFRNLPSMGLTKDSILVSRAWIIISAGQVFQLQSPGCKRHAANPHALWAQDPNGGSEVHE